MSNEDKLSSPWMHIRMTMRYAHVAPDHLRAAIRALDARQARYATRPEAAAASKSVTLGSRSKARSPNVVSPRGFAKRGDADPFAFTEEILVSAA